MKKCPSSDVPVQVYNASYGPEEKCLKHNSNIPKNYGKDLFANLSEEKKMSGSKQECQNIDTDVGMARSYSIEMMEHLSISHNIKML